VSQIKKKIYKRIKTITKNTTLAPFFIRNDFSQITKSENLFVISHFGQLAQVEGLIKLEKIKNNSLVILYTEANKKMPNLILNKYNKNLFDNISLLCLPRSPNTLAAIKMFIILKNYKKLLDIVNPLQLYVLSFEKHYSTLLSLANNKNIKLNLIEEGTATYKPKKQETNSIDYGKTHTHLLKILFISNPHLKAAFYRWEEYEKVYGAFPDKLSKLFLAKDFIHYFLHSLPDQGNNTNDFGITKNDIIYVSQRYPIEIDYYAECIITILELMAKRYQRRVFIKMHPKDPIELKNAYEKHIQLAKRNKQILNIETPDFLIENIVKTVKPYAIIGLTSTALVYTPLLSEKTRSLSISKVLLDRLGLKFIEAHKLITEHQKILQQFQHIEVI